MPSEANLHNILFGILPYGFPFVKASAFFFFSPLFLILL